MSSWCANAVALGALVITGCASLLGIDDVTGDRDRDGISNERDTCPNDYDPQQGDRDGDGIGDACDDCAAFTIDLDQDGRDDACDACIGAGATGSDRDGDAIDDGCDSCVDGVGTTGIDFDSDGLDDGCDPCITLGLDRDKDGIDDACDPCLFGPDHDEDRDGVADACDRCPADPDPQQEPSSDALGLACDPDPNRADVRRGFDGFGFDDVTKWQGDPAWRVVDDSMVPPIAGTQVQRQSFFKARGDFVVRAKVRIQSSRGSLGLYAQHTRGLIVHRAECNITTMGALSTGGSDGGGGGGSGIEPLDINDDIELILSRSVTATGVVVTCVGIDVHGNSATIVQSGTLVDFRVGLVASALAAGAYRWIDIVDHPIPVL